MDPTLLVAAAGLGVTIVTAVMTATWVLASKLSDIKEALSAHVAETAAKFKSIENNVIELKKRVPRVRR